MSASKMNYYLTEFNSLSVESEGLIEKDCYNYAYIQSIVLKKTLESISLDRRRGYDERDGQEEPEEIVKRLSETGNEGVESVTLNEE